MCEQSQYTRTCTHMDAWGGGEGCGGGGQTKCRYITTLIAPRFNVLHTFLYSPCLTWQACLWKPSGHPRFQWWQRWSGGRPRLQRRQRCWSGGQPARSCRHGPEPCSRAAGQASVAAHATTSVPGQAGCPGTGTSVSPHSSSTAPSWSGPSCTSSIPSSSAAPDWSSPSRSCSPSPGRPPPPAVKVPHAAPPRLRHRQDTPVGVAVVVLTRPGAASPDSHSLQVTLGLVPQLFPLLASLHRLLPLGGRHFGHSLGQLLPFPDQTWTRRAASWVSAPVWRD